MADVYWTGAAIAVAQVTTAQITGFDASTTYSLTVNGVSVSAAGDTDASTTATNLAAAWEAATHPYFTPITATANSDTVTMTGPADGMPFTVSSSVSGGAGTIGATSTTTSATGPYHWSEGDNWSGGAAPSAADNVYITKPDAKVLWDLDQNSLAIGELHVRDSVIIGLRADQVATVGTAATTDSAAPEYRQSYLKLQWTTCHIGEWTSPGTVRAPGRCKLHNAEIDASTTTVHNTASATTDTGFPAVRLLFDDADADLFVRYAPAGVGVAMDEPTETSTVGDVVVTDTTAGSQVSIGRGTTISNFTQDGGDNVLAAAATVTSATVSGGKLRTLDDFTITTMTVNDGTVTIGHKKTSGAAVTTLTQGGGRVQIETGEAITVTTWNLNEGDRIVDWGRLTVTNDNRSGRVTETVQA